MSASQTQAPTHAENGPWAALAQLVGLCAFAFGQPLFDQLSHHAAFFVARHSTAADLAGLVLGVLLGVPLALWLVERVLARFGSFGARAARALHVLLVGVLLAAIVLPLLTRAVAPPGRWVLEGALLAGGLGAALFAVWAPARTVASWSVVAAVMFGGAFLVHEDIVKIHGVGAPPLTESDSISLPASEFADAPPIVLVIFDEFPLNSLLAGDLTIDAGRFPNFARLAGHATWFRNATTSHDFTTPALPAILTGRVPEPDRLPIVADHPANLFTLLANGYRMRVRETVTELCPADLLDVELERVELGGRLVSLFADLPLVWMHIVLPEVHTRDLPAITGDWQHFWGDAEESAPGGEGAIASEAEGPGADGGAVAQAGLPERTDVPQALEKRGHAEVAKDRVAGFRRFIALVDDAPGPTLWMHHTVVPHEPWVYLPSLVRYHASRDVPGKWLARWGTDLWPIVVCWQRHLMQVGAVDTLLGELLDRLEAVGRYDDAVIAVVADHGISFQVGEPMRYMESTNAHDIARVPFLLKRPGQRRGEVSDRNVESIDLLPTLVEAAGLSLPFAVDGRSAFDEAAPERAHKTLYRQKGEPLRIDGALPTEWPTVQRKLELFGAGDWPTVLAAGDLHGLLGRPVTELLDDAGAPAQDLRAQVNGRLRYVDVDVSSGVLPCYVSGHVTSSDPEQVPTDVALAVRGTVVAVTRTFDRAAGRAEFAALLPASAFTDGDNTPTVLVIGDGGRLRTLSAGAWHLEGDRLVRPDGSAITLRTGAVDGEVTGATLEFGELRLVGWAADTEGGRPAETVIVFSDGRYVYGGPTGMDSMRVADRYNKMALRQTGFFYKIAEDLLAGPPSGRLRILGVLGDEAGELKLGPRAKWLAP